ncbi:endonuclease/exonuclease/phosphatase family protein [soil metagenome]
MRVATFNILHGLPTKGTTVDLDLLIAACRWLDADVLALQEVDRGVPRSHGHDLTAEVGNALGGGGGGGGGMAYRFAPTLERDGGQYGNALLVRGTLDDVEELRLPREGDREPRGAILATATVGDVVLSVAATHLSVRKRESGPQLDAVVAALAGRDRPRLLLGDFNRRTAQVRPAVTAAGLTLAGGGPTFPAITPFRQIDHVAVDGFTVESAGAVATGMSDHRALVVELSAAS